MLLFIDEATFTCELWCFYAVINGVSDRKRDTLFPAYLRVLWTRLRRIEARVSSQLLFEILIRLECEKGG